MSRALLALALGFALSGPPLQWASSLVEALLSGTPADSQGDPGSGQSNPDYGSHWDPNGGQSNPDYGNHWDPNGAESNPDYGGHWDPNG